MKQRQAIKPDSSYRPRYARIPVPTRRGRFFRPAPPLFLSPRRPPMIKLIGSVWTECEKDDVAGRAAQLAYYFLFSLFPMMLFLAALLAFLPIPNLLDNLLDYFSRVLPPEAYKLIRGTAAEVLSKPRFGLLSLGLLVSLWSSSSAMMSVIYLLNIAYSVPESRPWWRQRLLAIILTFGLALFIITALALIFFGGTMGEYMARQLGFGETFHAFWTLAQWPMLIGFMLFALDLVYFFAPNMQLRWRWVTPGAVFAMTCWIGISIGLRYYLSGFADYNITYGSIGSVIVLMLWLYLTGLLLLVGAEINGGLEQYVYGKRGEQ
ncbi:MAG: YihY/virulence factor BrkB family protein [Blastocatellia bacterium]